MFYHLHLCIHLNILKLYEGLTLFYAATGAKHFLSSFFVKGNALVIWKLIREKDTNDEQFFVRGNVKTEYGPSLKLDNAIEEIKL